MEKKSQNEVIFVEIANLFCGVDQNGQRWVDRFLCQRIMCKSSLSLVKSNISKKILYHM